ncbi:MAG: hypothetical protein JSV27_08380 [Candidatus Bathyarchaeota archaeon]|nr:MAG: hypothetical protein JSV27_08380 [Candidatus Bathyarchaeota archaeon]
MTLEDYVYCTFFGGSSNDRITGVAVTHGGEIVVVGGTFSTDLPVLNAYQENYAGGEVPEHLFVMGDAFVAKISEGGHLLWCTYLGGSGLEEPSCVAIDDEGNIIVIGLTRSDDFPVTGDAMQTVFGQGESDGFISVFDLDGALLHSTYIGGSGSENLRVFGIDAMGNFVLVGRTASADYPVTPDALQLELKGESDCFITVVSRDLSTVLYSTLLGGGSTDAGNEIAIDGEGTVIISGSTSSLDFPVTDDALQDTITGEERDCFLAKFSDSWELLYATFFGGSHMDDCFGLAIDASNNIHIVGRTWSPDFPVTPDAMQVSYSQESYNENAVDSIYSKISADGRTLLYSTYLGYDGWDSFLNVGFDSEGNVVLSGLADSGGFPVVRAFQEDQAGYADVFLMVLSPSGELLLSSYLGGMSFEHPSGQALVGGALVLVGNTHSTDFPVTEDALQRGMRGYQDGFVFKIDLAGYRRSAEEIRASGSRLRTYATVVPYAVVVGSIALWFVVMRRYFGSG